MSNKNISAVIFDMDGTMIDTEKIKENGWKYAGKYQNIIIDDNIMSEMRGTNRQYCKELLCNRFKDIDFNKLYDDRNKFIENEINNNGIKTKNGLIELLKFLKDNSYKIAVASSSEEEIIKRYLNNINVLDFFDVIVAGDMVNKRKTRSRNLFKSFRIVKCVKRTVYRNRR